MSLEDNKALMRAHVEALFNQHRVEQTEEFFTHDYLDHAPLPGQAPGLAGAKQKWTSYLTAVPDMRATIQDLVGEGDKLAVRWTVQGTHLGELLGIPPTGKPVRFSGISIYRLAAGKIAEQWEQWDRLDLLQQLGVFLAPGRVPAPVQPGVPGGRAPA